MHLLANVDDVVNEIVPSVVARYRESGILTWALIHKIESDVLDEVLATGRLSSQAVAMIRSHEALNYPKAETPASFEGHELMPIVFAAIEKAWARLH